MKVKVNVNEWAADVEKRLDWLIEQANEAARWHREHHGRLDEHRLRLEALERRDKQCDTDAKVMVSMDRTLADHDTRLLALERPKYHVRYTLRPSNEPQPGPDIATPADWRQVREDAERALLYVDVKSHTAQFLQRLVETARKFEGGK